MVCVLLGRFGQDGYYLAYDVNDAFRVAVIQIENKTESQNLMISLPE